MLAGLAMYGTAVWMAVSNDSLRRVEARLLAPIAGFVTGRHGAVTTDERVYFALGTSRAFGLQITSECTSALLLIPLFVMMGSFAIFTRLSLGRELVALIAGTVLILFVNALRVAGIAWATWRFGFDPGYSYSHIFVGSAFSLVGFVGAMLVALWILVRFNRPRSADASVSETRELPKLTEAGTPSTMESAPSSNGNASSKARGGRHRGRHRR